LAICTPGGNEPKSLTAFDEHNRVEPVFDEADGFEPGLAIDLADCGHDKMIAIAEHLNGCRELQAMLGEIARSFRFVPLE
jgi:hypothetical protein